MAFEKIYRILGRENRGDISSPVPLMKLEKSSLRPISLFVAYINDEWLYAFLRTRMDVEDPCTLGGADPLMEISNIVISSDLLQIKFDLSQRMSSVYDREYPPFRSIFADLLYGQDAREVAPISVRV